MTRSLLEAVRTIALRAGEAIMDVYATDFDVHTKADSSPVTAADEAAEAIIIPALRLMTPEIPVVSEEAVSRDGLPNVDHSFWLVDPLDGTRDFVERNGEFTVNIALIEEHRPLLGVVHAPAIGRTFGGSGDYAFAEEKGARRIIQCRPAPESGLVVVGSRHHGDPDKLQRFLAQHKVASFAKAGSSLKFCLLASGEADLYARFGPTNEWDTAAGHAVLQAAGGAVTLSDGTPLAYGKPKLTNPDFIAWGKR